MSEDCTVCGHYWPLHLFGWCDDCDEMHDFCPACGGWCDAPHE